MADLEWLMLAPSNKGELFFPEAAEWSTDKALEFFAYYLLDEDNSWLTVNPSIQYFQMGDMTWHGTEVWPPEG
jgi:predicted acyl esterase